MVSYSGSTTKATKGRRIMAKKLSTAMLTALEIARINGQVRKGDNQREAQLGMAGLVTIGTIVALMERNLLMTNPRGEREINRKGLRALCENEVISVADYSNLLAGWMNWMDVTHAEALGMAAAMQHNELINTPSLTAQREEDHAEALKLDERAPQADDLYQRQLRHEVETVIVERVHAGRVDYRILDTKTGRVSAPYRMREKTFSDNYRPVSS